MKKSTDQISFLDALEGPPTAESPAPTIPPVIPVAPPPPPIVTAPVAPKIWSVTELARDLRDQLKQKYNRILVQGEICDYKGIHRSGHVYMGLKDESAQIRVVIWKGVANKVPFEIKTGLEVIVTGTVDFYGAGGSLQIVADAIEPLGIGSLQLRFEQLKEKLQSEGLFEAARKKPLPDIVERIGIVTGKSTAALQDMLKIFRQRYPLVELYIFQASVQGEQAPREVVSAIKCAERFSEQSKKLDLLIIARGGGSYEDLFCFNDESLVRAVAHCALPTVSAIGHEIDFTICDFVADHRSATPSHAAQETTPDVRFIRSQLQAAADGMRKSVQMRVNDLAQKLDYLWNHLVMQAPHSRLKAQAEVVARIAERIQRAMKVRLEQINARFQRNASFLQALSPLKIFERGYALVQKPSGEVIRDANQVQAGDPLSIRLHRGNLQAKAE